MALSHAWQSINRASNIETLWNEKKKSANDRFRNQFSHNQLKARANEKKKNLLSAWDKYITERKWSILCS